MAPGDGRIGSRKADHLRVNLDEDVSSGVTAGFERWRFLPRALPELDLRATSTACDFLGHGLRAPILISCMTGGTREATLINRTLAEVAQSEGLALGLGSARVLIEDPSARAGFDVRDLARDVPLLVNLGAVQLTRGVEVDDCRRVMDLLGGDALVLHLNALQEALQGGGDVDFRGVLAGLERVCGALGSPVIVKEVGWGIPPDDVRRLFEVGVAAVDVAGAGGTSWSEVERHRAAAGREAVFDAFRDWGLPTAEAVVRARAAAPTGLLIGSGGVATGIDVAKAVALGADLVGVAGPFLRAAAAGPEPTLRLAHDIAEVLRLAMFATGAGTLTELRRGGRLERVSA